MNESVFSINSCRLCNGTEFRQILDFGPVALGNNYQTERALAKAAPAFPLGVQMCQSCSHFQLTHSVNPSLLYATNYTYLSSIGESFVKHFCNYADWIIDKTKINRGELIVDVGSNDGTCLSFFKETGFQVCGVDPAELPAHLANERGITTINDFFSKDVVEQIIQNHGKPSLVTSHNVLAHIDGLQDTLSLIYDMLKVDGWFCFEVGYFGTVKEKNLFDTIYHEHLDYHHAGPITNFLISLGFYVHEINFNEAQGGTIRVLAQKSPQPGRTTQVAKIIEAEKRLGLFDTAEVEAWQELIAEQMRYFGEVITKLSTQGYSIAGYGAPTKSTLLMALAGLGSSHISYISEDNELKVGRYLPTSGIEIRNAEYLFKDRPQVIVIFAWNFIDDIVKKLRNNLDYNPEIICPLPKLERFTLF